MDMTRERIHAVVEALTAEIGGEGKWLLITYDDHYEILWLDETFATEEVVQRAELVIDESM